MARRVSFAVAQPITIVGFFLSAFLMISLVSVASSPVFRIQPASAHALTQAFYYGIMSAGLYCIIAFLMCLTVYGAYRGHYEKEFRLTVSQRTLMLQTISFVVYLLLGALVFKVVEGWEYLDAVYWADFTLLTVGTGDYSPSTHLGRSLLFPFAIGGIVMVGLVIGSIRSLVLDRGKRKMIARTKEKKRERVLSSINPEERTIKTGPFNRIRFSQHGLSEAQRREQEFTIMRKIQRSAESRRRYTSLVASTFAALTLWFVGAVVFWQSEKPQGWSYFQALYFSYVSLLTIGYGDLSPISNSGKAFFVFWSILAVPTLTVLISNMGDTVVKSFSELTIWVGSLTVLPGEHGIRATLQQTARRIKGRQLFNTDELHVLKIPGTDNDRDARNQTRNGKNHALEAENTALDMLASHVEAEELLAATEEDSKGHSKERDIHFYQAVLGKELRKLIHDTSVSPPKQYTFAEWTYYLRLIGEDETDPSRHRKPPLEVQKREGQKPDLATAGREDENGDAKSWSWLGTRSPLMSSLTETEWLIQRISTTLERELGQFHKPPEKRNQPPISMADLRHRRSSATAVEDEEFSDLAEQKQVSSAELRNRQNEK